MYDCRVYRLTPDVRLGLVARFDLHPTTLLVLDALVDHDWADRAGNRKGFVYPKVARLAALTRRSERTVQYHLRRLERLGLISCSGHGGRSRPATVAIHWPRIVGEPKGRNRVSWPAREMVQPPSPPKNQTKQEQQAPAGAAAACPVGQPPRRGFWEEEPPPVEKRREIVAQVRRVLMGEDAIGRRTYCPTC
jgi:hypothetical protein